MCLRQSYERREITEVIWIDGDSNPADAMTKSRPCQALRDLIDSNRIDLRATGWVERNQQEVIPAEKRDTVNSTKNKEFPVCNPPKVRPQSPTPKSEPRIGPQLRPNLGRTRPYRGLDRTADWTVPRTGPYRGLDRTARIAPANRNTTRRPDRDNNQSGG